MQSKLPFVLLLLLVPTGVEGQQPGDRSPLRQGGAWVLTMAAERPGQPSVTLELDALNVVRGPIVDVRPALYLRCDNGKLEALVVTGEVLDRVSACASI